MLLERGVTDVSYSLQHLILLYRVILFNFGLHLSLDSRDLALFKLI